MLFVIAQLGAALIFLRLISLPIYNLFFHPLRKYPGPLLWRATRLTWVYYARQGVLPQQLNLLHEKYGPVVRTAPDELSFIEGAAWKDIYGHRAGTQTEENEKWVVAYAGSKTAPRGLLSAPRAQHSALRRLLSHGFSDRSLRSQEDIVRKYVDGLIAKLMEECGGGKERVDINLWYGCTTFDIIGDLGFAASFDSLHKTDHRHWSQRFSNPKSAGDALQATTRRMLLPSALCDWLNKHWYKFVANDDFSKYVFSTVSARAEYTVERPDLIDGMVRSLEKETVPKDMIMRTAVLLLAAGFETTASTLTAVTYFLASNPEALRRVTDEVRSSFKSAEDITFASVDKLSYMIACLSESLRMHPPVAAGLQRIAMPGGTTVAGHAVPEDTVISVPNWPAGRSSSNFAKPNEFRPERWLGAKGFESDRQDAVQVFSAGPRNCIGKNLALAEMRTVLAMVLFHFDIRLVPGMEGWAENQKFYNLWLRPPLGVYLTPVAA